MYSPFPYSIKNTWITITISTFSLPRKVTHLKKLLPNADLGKVSTRERLLLQRRHTHYVLNVVCGASWAIYINCPRQLALQCCDGCKNTKTKQKQKHITEFINKHAQLMKKKVRGKENTWLSHLSKLKTFVIITYFERSKCDVDWQKNIMTSLILSC